MTPERIKQIEAMLAEGDISTFGSDTVSCLEYVDVDRYADLESIVRELLAALSETGRWVSVSERPAPKGELLAIWISGHKTPCAGYRRPDQEMYHKSYPWLVNGQAYNGSGLIAWCKLPPLSAPPAVHETTTKEGM